MTELERWMNDNPRKPFRQTVYRNVLLLPPSHSQTFSGCYSLSMQIRTGIFPTIFTLIMIFFLKVGVKMLQITKICFHLLISQNVNFYH